MQQPTWTLPERAPRRPFAERIWARAVVMLAVALPLAFAAGWLAGFVPQSLESSAGAEGKLQAQRSVDAGDDGAPGKDPTTDGVTRTNDGLTSFVTSCGKVLDIVPTSARSRETR